MTLQNETFTVTIRAVDTDLRRFGNFDAVYFQEDAAQECSKSHVLIIRDSSRERRIALVGSLFIYEEHCAVLEGDVLTILQNNRLVRIDLQTAQVSQIVMIEAFGGNYEIHKLPHGYLVYGECQITFYDEHLTLTWDFSGNDIFASLSEKPAFSLKPDTILLYDFEGTLYELDFNGQLLRTEKETAL